jgi:hypothetical protein
VHTLSTVWVFIEWCDGSQRALTIRWRASRATRYFCSASIMVTLFCVTQAQRHVEMSEGGEQSCVWL